MTEKPRPLTNDEPAGRAPAQPEVDAASAALIEAFLRGEGAASADWRAEPLPPDHKSGFVAVIGRPNVGKSTLVNALVGQKVAIVSPKPQTTRRRLLGIRTRPDHQAIFIDTPGIHDHPLHRLGAQMVESAVAVIPDADVILFVVDVSVPPGPEDERIARLLAARAGERPVFFVLNKMDQLRLETAQARIESYWALLPGYADSMPVSALRGTNVERLMSHILDRLPAGPRYYPDTQVTDQTERQIAAELVREAVLRYTQQEVPHAVAVLVEHYEERPNGVLYVGATLWVEKESQRPILIGKGGEMLKRIGAAARKELERMVGSQVYLELWVKVRPDWRNRPRDLRELGLEE